MAQIVALLLAPGALGEGAADVGGGDEGEEVGGVQGEGVAVQPITLLDPLQHVHFKARNGVFGKRVHQIPEMLAVQWGQGDAQEELAAGGLGPLPPALLAGGPTGAADGRQYQRHTDGKPMPQRFLGEVGALRLDVSVDQLDDLQVGDELEEGSHRTMGIRLDGEGADLSLQPPQEIFRFAQVGQDDGAGLAVDPARLDDVPVFVAAGGLGLNRRHAQPFSVYASLACTAMMRAASTNIAIFQLHGKR